MNLLYGLLLVGGGAVMGAQMNAWLGIKFPQGMSSSIHKLFYMAWGAALFTMGSHIL